VRGIKINKYTHRIYCVIGGIILEITTDLIFALITVFTLGMGVGAYFKEKKLENVFNPYIKKYTKQKDNMWKEFKKIVNL
jgi:hypothetical protein